MQQRVNDKVAKVGQKRDSQSNVRIQKKAEESDVLTHDHSPIENITCKIGDNVCAAEHVSVIQRTGLFHPMNEGRRVQSLTKLQRQYGNRFMQRVIAQHAIQTKLKIGQPGDIYEQEADRIAEQVMRMPEPQVQRQPEEEEEEEEELQAKELPGRTLSLTANGELRRQPLEEEEEEVQMVQRQIEEEKLEEEELLQGQAEEEEEELQAKEISGQTPEGTPNLEARVKAIKGGGQPLPASSRAFFEPRFGCDFGRVRVHTDTEAHKVSGALNARAFTMGHDMFFRQGEYSYGSSSSRKLLAHELVHVVQQGAANHLPDKRSEQEHNQPVRRQSVRGFMQHDLFVLTGGVSTLQRQQSKEGSSVEVEIDYEKAERLNKKYADELGWDERLSEISLLWNVLWKMGSFKLFANLVAHFQIRQGFTGSDVDGVLGPCTWDRLRPIGEVIAEQQEVKWRASKELCYEATKERLLKGYERATGEELVAKEQKQDFRIILRSNPSEMSKAGIDKKYWGTSAAGALVYLGKGEFVSQEDIWSNKGLKPGAAIQVWKKESDLERIKEGKMPLSWGTSAVFVEYVGEDSIKVLHGAGRPETWDRGDFEVWIGANLHER